MGAVDLLFATKPESERLHQAALRVLLERTPLLGQLMGRPIPDPSVAWEPEGGAFDLRVNHAGDEKSILIELKVDGLLSWPQINRQTGRTASSGEPMCILLGISAITRGERWGHWRNLDASARPKLYSGADLKQALEAMVAAAIPDKDVRELAESYIRVLEKLATRTQGYRGKPIEAFDHRDYLGYFDELRQAVDFGGSTVECVSNAAGGFVCCAWKAVPNENGGLYLQFENQSLCVKLRAGDLEKGERRGARRKAVDVAREVAPQFPDLMVEPTKGKGGKTMTLVRLPGIKLTPDPRDEGLLASLLEAQAFVRATAAKLG